MSHQSHQDDLMSSESSDGKLRLELRKLSNSEGWVSSAAQLSSRSSSRGSTPLSQKSTSRKSHSINNKQVTATEKPVQKSKKFHMVLEKDDDYEIDYLTPDEGDSSASSIGQESLSNSLSESNLSDHEEVLPPGSPVTSWHEDEDVTDEDEEIPELKLPKSSEDLLLPNNLILQALSVYEVLRHFRNTLRLSPFLFEDFCAALKSKETTVLINECHIMLLKNLLKEEDNLGILFVPVDQKDAYNASLYFIDYLTWPEVLRAFVQSSPDYSFILAIVEEDSFPCVEVAKKIQVLQFLSDLFLSSTKIRDELMSDGSIRYDDHCRVCHRLGDLLCCETCPAVYHLACCNPPLKEVPEEEWQCEVCQTHKLNGVSNCELESEFGSQYLRHDPVGVDRHGRKYWYLVRRLFIESPDEIRYYTTYDEFKFVLSKLDHNKYEIVLCEALKDVLEDFPRQAKITEELTNEAKWKEDTKTQIEVQKENLKRAFENEKLEQEKKEEPGEQANSELPVSSDQTSVVWSSVNTTTTASSCAAANTTTSVASESMKLEQSNSVATEFPKTEQIISTPATPPATTPAVPVSAPVSISSSLPPLAPIRADTSRIVLPKANFIPLSIKVPLTRCDAFIQPKSNAVLNPMVKVAPRVQVKPSPQLKNLFVLSKDGVKTPLTIGADGKLTAGLNQRFIMINKQAAASTPTQGRLSRELKRLQFTAAGPKMQKIPTPLGTSQVENSQTNNLEPINKTAPEVLSKPPKIPAVLPDPFRLGEDRGYKQYKNHFVENTLALNKYQHKEEKDKDRHVGYKFSLTGPVEFDWSGTLYGSRDEVVHTMRTALFSFEQQVPLCFMHSRWEQYRKMWGRMLVHNDTVKAFAAVLGILEMAIRSNAKKTVWNEGIGQVRLRRITPAEKEQYEKRKKHKSKIKEDIVQRNAVWCKYPLPVQVGLVSKLRDEDYRITGFGGWMWLSATFKCLDQKAQTKPFTLCEEVSSSQAGDSLASSGDVIDVSKNLLMRSAVYNRRWTASRVDKLLRWRILQEKDRIRQLEKSNNEEKAEMKSDSQSKEEGSQTTQKHDSNDTNVATSQPQSTQNSTDNTKDSSEKMMVDGAGNTENSPKKIDIEDEIKPQNIGSSESSPSAAESCRRPQTTPEPMETEKNDSNQASAPNLEKEEQASNVSEESECMEISSPESTSDKLPFVAKQTIDDNHSEDNTMVQEMSDKSDVPKPNNEEIREDAPSNPESKNIKNNSDTQCVIDNSQPAAEDTTEINHALESSDVHPTAWNTQVVKTHDSHAERDLSDCKDEIKMEQTQPLQVVKHEQEEIIPTTDQQDNLVASDSSSRKQEEVPPANESPKQQDISPTDQPEERKAVSPLNQSCEQEDVAPSSDRPPEQQVVTSTAKSLDPVEKISQSNEQPESSPSDTSAEHRDINSQSDAPSTQSLAPSILHPASPSEQELPHDPSPERKSPTDENTLSKTLEVEEDLSIEQQQAQEAPSEQATQGGSKAKSTKENLEPAESWQQYRISRRFRKGARRKVVACEKPLAKTWKLTKPASDRDKKKPIKMPLPWNFAVSKEKRKSIFRLPQISIRHMTCRGGLAWYPLGFRHVQKNPASLGTAWRYKLQNAKTLASIAHLLRVLWHSMRWEDIVTKPSTDDVIHTIYNDDDIISVELLKRRNVGKSGLRSEYFVRRIVMPSADYDEEIPRSEAYTPSSRSGLRARSRQMNLRERTKKDTSLAKPKVQTLWMPEDEIELWQIRQFDSMIRLQQKAALAKKEAENSKVEKKEETLKARLQNPLPASQPVKQITISSALLQQATALHRSQGTANPATSKIISFDISQVMGSGGKFTTVQSSTAGITIKPPYLAATAKSVQGVVAANQLNVTATATKIIPKKIVVKPAAISSRSLEPDPKSKHPTIKLSGIIGASKVITSLPTTTSMTSKEVIISPKPSMLQQVSSRGTSSMQVKLSAAQLGDLMKVGTDTVVKVSINMPDGSPGVGHLQVIPSGSQVSPTEGQQLMQCKVGNEVKKFLLTAAAASNRGPVESSNNYPVESEVSLETPSLRHRLEQLQQRQQELSKPTLSNNFHKLMTDKDPLWGGRTQTPTNEKSSAPEKKKESAAKKKHGAFGENREERQRRNAVQHVIKSILDRIEKKEELEARKRRKEEREELQKKRRENMDLAKSQQRMQSRLFQVLVKHEEQLKHDIRKRRALIEKYLIHIVQNELHEEQVKRRRLNVETAPKSPHKNNIKSSVLVERNNRESPQKRAKRKQSPVPEPIERSPPSKKRKPSASDKLYCICKTPYDESRFYIGCDLCMSWFHGACVGISERKAKSMDTWVCRDCQSSKPQQELYCLCKTPYDDSQFYIGCDVCQDWYHGRCVGISEDQARKIESYTCPRCKKQTRDATREKLLTGRELAELTRIVKLLQNHKMAWPFLEPVREADAPGYYKVVTRPMDLQTVMKRLQNKYYTKLSDLVGDVSLIFDNCRQFNGPESNLVRCAEIVETVFVGKIRDMRGR